MRGRRIQQRIATQWRRRAGPTPPLHRPQTSSRRGLRLRRKGDTETWDKRGAEGARELGWAERRGWKDVGDGTRVYIYIYIVLPRRSMLRVSGKHVVNVTHGAFNPPPKATSSLAY